MQLPGIRIPKHARHALAQPRLLGRDHWSSDVFVGSALGYFIGSHSIHIAIRNSEELAVLTASLGNPFA